MMTIKIQSRVHSGLDFHQICWNMNAENAALAGLALDGNAAAMRLGDVFDDGQSQSVVIRFRCYMGLE